MNPEVKKWKKKWDKLYDKLCGYDDLAKAQALRINELKARVAELEAAPE